MKTIKSKFLYLVCLIFSMVFLCAAAQDEEGTETGVYTLTDESGNMLTAVTGTPCTGDEYISESNRHFRVLTVNEQEKSAQVKDLGDYEMPDVSWLSDEVLPAASINKAIAIYCTHSDESYKPDDGTSSDETRGGIYDVAEMFKEALEYRGVKVYYDNATHFPHDSGAYRRSRQTAAALLKNGVDALVDIHRDGIPNVKEYTTELAGKKITKVRLLVGRSNQNASANKQFATQLKAVADKVYPGLIKDIYIGKGTYNQDLTSQAILLEFGTYTSDKDQVTRSTGYMADVMTRTLYGTTGAAGASDTGFANSSTVENSGGWSGIVWVIIVAVVALAVYLLLQTGGGKAFGTKAKSVFREFFGGLFGKSAKK